MARMRAGVVQDAGVMIRRVALFAITIATPWVACNDTGAGGGLQPGVVTFRLSTNAQGLELNGPSVSPSISGDGRYVAFASRATNLVPQDADGFQDIFVKDRQTGAVSNISFVPPTFVTQYGQGPVAGDCTAPAISGDGQTVAFLSKADIIPVPFVAPNSPWYTATTHTTTNVFVYTPSRGIIRVLGTVSYVAWPDADVTDLSLSSDGRYLAFATGASQMSPFAGIGLPASSVQVYVADLTLGTIQAVSLSVTVPSSGCGGICGHPQISGDGQSVVYDSNASDLIPSGPTLFAQVYLSKSDGSSTTLVSRGPTAGGAIGVFNSWFPRVSADGRYVTYLANEPDVSIHPGLFNTAFLMLRDMTLFTNTVVANNPFKVSQAGGIDFPPPPAQGSMISADGRFILFKSQDQTLTSTPFTVPQIFLWDRQGTISLLSSNTITGAAASSECFNPVLSTDGLWAAWDTLSSNLISLDDNGVSDVFVSGPSP